MYGIRVEKLDKIEINRRLKEIEKGIGKLKEEKQQLLKMRRDLKHQNQSKKPKIHLLLKQQKYLVANARVADKVYSVHIGKQDNWKNWQNNKELMDFATKKMKEKLKEKGL